MATTQRKAAEFKPITLADLKSMKESGLISQAKFESMLDGLLAAQAKGSAPTGKTAFATMIESTPMQIVFGGAALKTGESEAVIKGNAVKLNDDGTPATRESGCFRQRWSDGSERFVVDFGNIGLRDIIRAKPQWVFGKPAASVNWELNMAKAEEIRDFADNLSALCRDYIADIRKGAVDDVTQTATAPDENGTEPAPAPEPAAAQGEAFNPPTVTTAPKGQRSVKAGAGK